MGLLFHTMLPEEHLSTDTKDVVKLGIALIAAMAALVLDLRIASAKSTFDTGTKTFYARHLNTPDLPIKPPAYHEPPENRKKYGGDVRVRRALYYPTSSFESRAETTALRVAQGAAQVANAVTDADFVELKKHYTDA